MKLDYNTKKLEDKVDKMALRESYSNTNTLLIKQESNVRILLLNKQKEAEKKAGNEKHNLLVKKLSKSAEDANYLKEYNK